MNQKVQIRFPVSSSIIQTALLDLVADTIAQYIHYTKLIINNIHSKPST